MLYAVFEFYTLSRKTGTGKKKGYMDHREEKPIGLESEKNSLSHALEKP